MPKKTSTVETPPVEADMTVSETPEVTASEAERPPASSFPYSQKLFHVANGTVYSVFSPTHGRSCGMRPTFLCRQRGSPRESRGRGRRSSNRCLKFHNFIPSESITSEKEDGCQDDVWKVHAECRLQEEHGTKQIMVSQWSLSSDTPSGPQEVKLQMPPPASEASSKEGNEIALKRAPFSTPFSSLRPSDHLPKTSNFLGIQDELFGDSGVVCGGTAYACDNVDGREHCETPSSTNSSAAESVKDEPEVFLGGLSKKHRRKPVQTRRVVPYNKYLSLMEDEPPQPLDLSMKTTSRTHDDITHSAPTAVVSSSVSGVSSCVPFQPFSSVPFRHRERAKSYHEKSPLQEALEAPLHSVLPHRFPHADASMTMPFGHALHNLPSTSTEAQHPSYSSTAVSDASSTLLAALQENQQGQPGTSRGSPDLPRALRKPSQRSLIKQKLEDTFKQNGFLVKTKQVSDGDATFCKFRQLRKYTRYYLKSWHHHLPAEVHKLWKGFLPPKTHPGGHGTVEQPKESHDNP